MGERELICFSYIVGYMFGGWKIKCSSCDLIHHSLTLQLEAKPKSFSWCRQLRAPTLSRFTEVGWFSPVLLGCFFALELAFDVVPGSDLVRGRVVLRKPVLPKTISAAGNSQKWKVVASHPEESNLKAWNEVTLHSQLLTYGIVSDTDFIYKFIHIYCIVGVFSHN